MTNIDELYQYADDNNIDVEWYVLSKAESLSAPLEDGSYAVAIDPTKLKSSAEELVKTAHELGHCTLHAFYNQYSPFDNVKRHENRANKWAIRKLIPRDELYREIANGHPNVWELAEIFGVPEPFMQKALNLYEYGNLDGY